MKLVYFMRFCSMLFLGILCLCYLWCIETSWFYANNYFINSSGEKVFYTQFIYKNIKYVLFINLLTIFVIHIYFKNNNFKYFVFNSSIFLFLIMFFRFYML